MGAGQATPAAMYRCARVRRPLMSGPPCGLQIVRDGLDTYVEQRLLARVTPAMWQRMRTRRRTVAAPVVDGVALEAKLSQLAEDWGRDRITRTEWEDAAREALLGRIGDIEADADDDEVHLPDASNLPKGRALTADRAEAGRQRSVRRAHRRRARQKGTTPERRLDGRRAGPDPLAMTAAATSDGPGNGERICSLVCSDDVRSGWALGRSASSASRAGETVARQPRRHRNIVARYPPNKGQQAINAAHHPSDVVIIDAVTAAWLASLQRLARSLGTRPRPVTGGQPWLDDPFESAQKPPRSPVEMIARGDRGAGRNGTRRTLWPASRHAISGTEFGHRGRRGADGRNGASRMPSERRIVAFSDARIRTSRSRPWSTPGTASRTQCGCRRRGFSA